MDVQIVSPHKNPGEQLDGITVEDGKCQARWKQLICMPNQFYEVTFGKVRRIFFGILSVELDGVRARKWNSDRVIVFQSVILQRAQGINNSKHICARILF